MKIGTNTIASLKIGSTDISEVRIGSVLVWQNMDADAAAFIAAASITDTTQKNAINKAFIDLKSYGIWSKIKGAYILKLGSASTARLNIKNPIDEDTAFRLAFFGAWGFYTGTDGGAESSVINSYCETFFNVSSQIEDWHNDHHMGFKTTIYNTPEGNGWNVGVGNSGTGDPLFGIANRRQFDSSGLRLYDFGNSSTGGRISDTTSSGIGFYLGSTVASNDHKLFLNGTTILSSTADPSGTVPNDTLWFSALNPDPDGTIYRLADRYSFFTFGYGLTPTEALNYTTIINTLLATL
jgi:hypothetical protein